MAVVERPLDTSAAVNGVAETLSGYSDSVGNLHGEFTKMGGTTLAGWYGAAERMTTSEIQAVGRICKRIGASLGRASTALKTYGAVLKQAETDLDALQTKLNQKIPRAGDMPTVGGMPLYLPSVPTIDPENVTILDRVYTAGTTCRDALMAEANKFALGPAWSPGNFIPTLLPFQRNPPLLPGAPHKKTPGLPSDVGSDTGGPGTRQLQELLKARGWRIEVTGRYDAQTARVVRQFQLNKGLDVKKLGKVDVTTWDAIWNKKIIW